jgi:hypothetical protein
MKAKSKKKHLGTIMSKAKVHKNEDLKLYDRKRTKKEERTYDRQDI